MIDIIALISRWTHIFAAAVVVGGFVFSRFVFYPAMSTLSEEDQAKLREQIAANLRPWALTSIVLLVLSGGYIPGPAETVPPRGSRPGAGPPPAAAVVSAT